jgi:hypothetical protein
MMPIILALILFFSVATAAGALEGSQPAGTIAVNGDVLYWEGEELIIKEISGQQVRLRVTTETKIEGVAGRLKTGDKIAAQANSDGQALSITLQIPDSGSSAILPGLRQ